MLVNPERGYFSKFYSACPYRLFFFFFTQKYILVSENFFWGGGFLLESGKVDTKHDWIRLCVNLAARSISRDLAERLLSKTPQKSFQNDEGRLEEMGGGGYHFCSEKAGQLQANSLQKKKLWRWQVVPALMDCFPDNCQRWQGHCWFSPPCDSRLLCHSTLWWRAAGTKWPSRRCRERTSFFFSFFFSFCFVFLSFSLKLEGRWVTSALGSQAAHLQKLEHAFCRAFLGEGEDVLGFFSFSSERFPRWRCPRAQMSQPLAHMPSISTRRWEGKLLQRLIWKSILLSIFFFCSLCCQQNMCSGCCFVLVCELVWLNLFCHSSFRSLSIAAYPLQGLVGAEADQTTRPMWGVYDKLGSTCGCDIVIGRC